ncbi:MAG: protein-L-isoaspartate(D-aspartate) O-methyltransferase [Nanoarchaeota archaeon]|nr:protein-L-isoaspartate(D-aspartate) O-methyltransferase [Nanoarchaeota archaeon]
MKKDKKELILNYWKKDKIITDKKVLNAFKKVERQNFVPKYLKEFAYDDVPLHIGEGQTISQPTTVALMTQALNIKKGDNVLEVGSGSGYQAAILSELVGEKGKVFTIEYLKELYLFAKKNLKSYKNVKVLLGDGSKGYNAEAPFDKIIVTAASPVIPPPLIEQLKTGGVLLIPVGEFIQDMLKITKTKSGLKKEDLGEFRFVPLKGEHGF